MTELGTPPPPRIRLGMVGGGSGAFIGGVHRIASRIDGEFDLVAGALSSTPERSLASGQTLGLAPDRIYPDFETMARRESEREDGIEAVSIVTPNHMHFAAAEAFIRAGIAVICDKPITTTLEEARRLHELSRHHRVPFVLTHNYSGYPLIRHARAMVAGGELGAIRVVNAEYIQGWLAEDTTGTDNKQAAWRVDPSKAGAGGAIGDIGTHAHHLALFVSGLRPEQLLADLDAFVPGRTLDDNAHIMLRYAGGAKGMIWTSQVAVGRENALSLRVVGERGMLEWAQENPNVLLHTPQGEATRMLTRGGPGVGEAGTRVTRIPGGHPEGYLEAFATIYAEAAAIIRASQRGVEPDAAVMAPGTSDGVDGLAFIEACVRSSRQGASWVRIEA